jgi:osmotically inducible protein OsmC
MKNNATAVWKGNGMDGKGLISSRSKVLDQVPYSYITRMENGKAGTNPEELIAAAHAACFLMKLAFVLQSEGYVANELKSNCETTIEAGVVTNAHLSLEADIPKIDKNTFAELVENSGMNCPVSKLLNTKVTLSYELVTERKQA